MKKLLCLIAAGILAAMMPGTALADMGTVHDMTEKTEEACEALGRMYETGEGAEPDPRKAMAYYAEGVKRGSAACGKALEKLREQEGIADGR